MNSQISPFILPLFLDSLSKIADLCYRQQLVLDGQPVEVEIVDVSHRKEVSSLAKIAEKLATSSNNV